ncbi:MAG: sugar phosphate nucleotidyltransferase [Bryobacteraceae bacterium]|nr:NTP transferase domain-containing protein [Solibacteraceae bacterium]MCO5351399.1 sugar phosphate nucleotidyltransferase [Bryobacteraceae bacterium]
MAQPHHYALILAGGRGTRFWPRSRTRRAKQVLEIVAPGTLIQQTVRRLEPVIPRERIWILTNPLLREEIIRQLPGVPRAQVVAEPVARNTAPAIGLAAQVLLQQDPDAVLGVFPADHYIARPAAFLRLVRAAYKCAAQGRIALIGIQPRWAETGYGYVEFPAGDLTPGSLQPATVTRFLEKPDAATARKFVDAGNYCWNAGMFFWRASVFMDALDTHLPRTAALLRTLPSVRSRRFRPVLAEVFPQCENISVDYAVLEHATGVAGFAAGDIGWNDVGSWNAVYELLPRDAHGNAARGDALFLDSAGNLVDAPAGKLVALAGVRDLVVVDTPDALLVCPREMAQSVGAVVKLLEKQKRAALL